VCTSTALNGDIPQNIDSRAGWSYTVKRAAPARWPVEGSEMNPEIGRKEARANEHLERATICLPDFSKQAVSHGGDDSFTSILQKYFDSSESNASERLVKLKEKLRDASTYDFWGILMEEMCDIVGAQCGFVAKRILVDDENTAVEMPPLGEPGSCLLGVAFYLNNGADVKSMYRDYKYQAYGR
jgi:hypothetical protein